MKSKNEIGLNLFMILFVISIFSCSENNSINTSEKDVEFSAYQIPGCNSPLRKSTNPDSIFYYSFNDTLKVDFRVSGNCCPDSNRFETNYTVIADTLFVVVSDTAQNNCKCNCYYMMHLEILGLLNDKYIFVCNYPAMYSPDTVKYREILFRK